MFIISDMGILHFICALFYCTPQMSCFLFCFYKFVPQVCGNSGWNKSIGTIFLTASAHFVSLCRILVILALFQAFIVIMSVMVTCNQWSLLLLRLTEVSAEMASIFGNKIFSVLASSFLYTTAQLTESRQLAWWFTLPVQGAWLGK